MPPPPLHTHNQPHQHTYFHPIIFNKNGEGEKKKEAF